MSTPVRLHKFMADAGIASRRQCEAIIAAGRVTLNGKVVTKLGTTVVAGKDHVKVDGKLIHVANEKKSYFVFYKPRSVMTTLADPQGRPTIADYIPRKSQHLRLFPVGRLDYDVTGCLLLTNDGELAHRLMHPKYKIPRIYEVKVRDIPSPKALQRLQRKASECEVEQLREKDDYSWFSLTLYEGKYHQVKRMWMEVGHPVIKMHRRSYAGINLRGMERGEARELKPKEIEQLRLLVGLF